MNILQVVKIYRNPKQRSFLLFVYFYYCIAYFTFTLYIFFFVKVYIIYCDRATCICSTKSRIPNLKIIWERFVPTSMFEKYKAGVVKYGRISGNMFHSYEVQAVVFHAPFPQGLFNLLEFWILPRKWLGEVNTAGFRLQLSRHISEDQLSEVNTYLDVDVVDIRGRDV